jgi:hypothetical protein
MSAVQIMTFETPATPARAVRTSPYNFGELPVSQVGQPTRGLFVVPQEVDGKMESVGDMSKRVRSSYQSFAKRHNKEGNKFASERRSHEGVEGLLVWRTA